MYPASSRDYVSVGGASDLPGDVQIKIAMTMPIFIFDIGVLPAGRQIPVVQLFTGSSVNSAQEGACGLNATTLCHGFRDFIFHSVLQV